MQDPSHFASIVESEDMALGLVARSPLQFDYVTEQQQQLPVGSNAPAATPASKTTTTTTTFLVKIVANEKYKNKVHITDSDLYGNWPAPHGSLLAAGSPMRAALRDAVPRDLARDGLSDWDSCGQLDDDSPLASGLVTTADFFAARKQRVRRRSEEFYSLVEAYEARHGGKEKGGEEGGDKKDAEA